MRTLAFPDGIADFRSDTVTRPTPDMLRAMTAAAVGDDVYGEDPTVNDLEETCAALLGTEAALFVPTGSMGNQIALQLQSRPGDHVVCTSSAHVRIYELGAAAAVSGLSFLPLESPDGGLPAAVLEEAFRPGPYYARHPTLLVWENTHNATGGRVLAPEVMEAGSAVVRSAGARVHLDGARLWNAVAAAAVPAARYAAAADTTMFCFSKGLGAPIGSVVCGSAGFVTAARVVRKRLGGGMRQVGVLAAAAAVALADRERLTEDHTLAADLAAGLDDRFPGAAGYGGTNMVLLDEAALPVPAVRVQQRLEDAGIKVGFIAPGILRFVTHRDVDAGDVRRVLTAVDDLVRA